MVSRDRSVIFPLLTFSPDLVSVHGLCDPHFDKDAIQHLIIDSRSKLMVQTLCEMYDKHADQNSLVFADFVRGKGEGQIILLHGPPGTGKTLTAGTSNTPYIEMLANMFQN